MHVPGQQEEVGHVEPLPRPVGAGVGPRGGPRVVVDVVVVAGHGVGPLLLIRVDSTQKGNKWKEKKNHCGGGGGGAFEAKLGDFLFHGFLSPFAGNHFGKNAAHARVLLLLWRRRRTPFSGR